ncbi:hypothetical protein AB833_15360 [Chromatiales bacterium (ex Bugula neritina AB1)]|nr:hypothetical protein AB833_15360 [Chromatiales bacterium (ex Bugula neritina AB1)]
MGNAGVNGFNFLITTLFDLFAFVVMLRFLMQVTRADYYNPVSQFIVKVTDPLLLPIRKIVPGLGGYDIAALVLCFLALFIKLLLLKAVNFGGVSAGGWAGSFIYTFAEVIDLAFVVFIYTILAMVILSWVSPGGHPISGLLRSITAPVLRPIQRMMPDVGGFDLSPLAALILLQLGRIVTSSLLGG